MFSLPCAEAADWLAVMNGERPEPLVRPACSPKRVGHFINHVWCANASVMTSLLLLTRYLREGLIAALVALALALTIHGNNLKARLMACQATNAAQVASYRAAAEKARSDDLAHVAAVKAQQDAATEKVTHEYETRLADTDARYQRLRSQADAYSRSQREPDMSAAREATCQSYAASSCDAIPATLKAAQDNTDQLVALQAWVAGASVVQ